jgi:hypothetical protein
VSVGSDLSLNLNAELSQEQLALGDLQLLIYINGICDFIYKNIALPTSSKKAKNVIISEPIDIILTAKGVFGGEEVEYELLKPREFCSLPVPTQHYIAMGISQYLQRMCLMLSEKHAKAS